MEKQLLPDVALKPAYDKVVWLYVYRDFSASPADLAAERTSLRLSVTSWPQLLLADPETLEVLADTQRTVTTFLSAVNRAGDQVAPARSIAAALRISRADDRAIELQSKQLIAAARQCLDDDDVAVRFRALQVLAEKDVHTVVTHAEQLLLVPNDAFRYEVCKVLAGVSEPSVANALEAIVRNPANSRNPNVLRITATQALATCGNAGSVAVIAPFACSGEYRNGLTGTAVDALATIAMRDPKAKSSVLEVLARSFPQPSTRPTEHRLCTALAKRVHAAMEKVNAKQVPFPESYDQNSRADLIRKLSE